MDIFDTLKVIGRWWFVALPLSILVIAATLIPTDSIAPQYRADGSIVFIGPLVRDSVTTPGETEIVNPLLEQPSALTTAVVVTALAINSPDTTRILREEGLSTQYEVGAKDRTPIMLVITYADDRDVAAATASRLVELISDDVRDRQAAANVPAEDRVTVEVIGLSVSDEPDYSERLRLRIAGIVIGLAMVGLVVFFYDGLKRRRHDLRASEASVADPVTGRGTTGRSSRSHSVEDGMPRTDDTATSPESDLTLSAMDATLSEIDVKFSKSDANSESTPTFSESDAVHRESGESVERAGTDVLHRE